MRSFAKSAPEDRQVAEYFESEMISDSAEEAEVEMAQRVRECIFHEIQMDLSAEDEWEYFTGIYGAPLTPEARFHRFISELNHIRELKIWLQDRFGFKLNPRRWKR